VFWEQSGTFFPKYLFPEAFEMFEQFIFHPVSALFLIVALGAISELTDSRQPLLSYTAVYSVALILITAICQVLFFLL
jgi:hypothetical protein